VSSDLQVLELDIEGRRVTCYESDGCRLWRCECAHFQRTLATYKEGFCPLVFVAIEHLMSVRGEEHPATSDKEWPDQIKRLIVQ
jgi:hypothetical protein